MKQENIFNIFFNSVQNCPTLCIYCDIGIPVYDMSSNRNDTIFKEMVTVKSLEESIKQLWSIGFNNNIGMNEALVDNDGYPRGEIDVYQVRHARHQLKCLQNDHTALMKRIEEGLNEIHTNMKSSDTDPNGVNMAPPSPLLEPFVKVDRVDLASPAHIGGVTKDILQLPNISTWFGGVCDIARVDLSLIHVKIYRDGAVVNLTITPRQWSGRGLLGCNVVPYDGPDR
ncbi:unnamed protein product [Meganyctiphanes norvegica]|uniref:Nas2 N-terminal domain-containing protein n=1 Tax=Meganyctiphanes norvegica TaxID=48144 RepID=A0AAV2RNM4_MEGNR